MSNILKASCRKYFVSILFTLLSLTTIYESKAARVSPRAVNLEAAYSSQVIVEPNAWNSEKWGYLAPNERTAGSDLNIHISQISHPGVLVSTGTERSFFDLLLCKVCTGLIVRDIDPDVKAYNDYNILALREAENFDEYLSMTSPPKRMPWSSWLFSKSALKIITQKFEADNDMSDTLKVYYRNNLKHMHDVYMTANSPRPDSDTVWWRQHEGFNGVKYFSNAAQFAKLHAMAKAGMIISTMGSINELEVFNESIIVAIDVSNISDYIFLGFHLPHSSIHVQPRIIWTTGRDSRRRGQTGFLYNSFLLEPLSTDEHSELQKLFSELLPDAITGNVGAAGRVTTFFIENAAFFEDRAWSHINNPFTSVYTRQVLVALRRWKAEKMSPHHKSAVQ